MVSEENKKIDFQSREEKRITDVDRAASIRENEQNLSWLQRNKDPFRSIQQLQLDHLRSRDYAAQVLSVSRTVSLALVAVAEFGR